MEFCPKCGGLLVSSTGKSKCTKCNYTSKEKIKLEAVEKSSKKATIQILKEKDTMTLPVTAEICDKCGNKEAYFWSSQTRAADEAETRFFRCTKCNHTWRKYK